MTRSRIRPDLTRTFSTRKTLSGESKEEYALSEPYIRALSKLEKMETTLIDAFLTCTYQEHVAASRTRLPIYRSSFTYHKTRRRTGQAFFRQTRSMQTLPINAQPLPPPPPFTRNEYLNMLDYYEEPAPIPPCENYPPTPVSASPQPVAEISRPVDENIVTSVRTATEGAIQVAVDRLVTMLDQEDCPHDTIFQAYHALPSPGVVNLWPWKRRLLLKRLSRVERKNPAGLVRYMSIVEDMKAAGLAMTDAEWNSILAFTGRCFAPVPADEVESVLRIWKEMEQDPTVESGEVTFNILFDVAAKAGKYVLAEMILKEMRARNLPLNRYARTNIIYYHGLRGDGDAVRDAYRAFVKAGEVVDTVVMNCVIAALLVAGEPQAAELVYERMKRMYAVATNSSPPSYRNWRQSRDLGRILNRAARDFRFGSEENRNLQKEQLLCPDLRTYAIFIEYHVSQTGELRRIIPLLEEMQALRVPMHGRIFVKLLKGFAKHGGVRYTSWTSARLEKVWMSLLAVLGRQGDHEAALGDVHLGKWMVVWAVRAFYYCCGHARAMDIWAELRSRWKPSDYDERAAMTLLGDILSETPNDARTRTGNTIERPSVDVV